MVFLDSPLEIRGGFRPPVGRLRAGVWDMEGGVLDGGTAGPCGDDEAGPAVIFRLAGLTVRNGTFRNWPDGVTLRAPDLTFENVIFENCEDAASTGAGAAHWTFRHCWFRPARPKTTHSRYRGDKALQANVTTGDNRVEDCHFWNFENAVRIGLHRYSGPPWEGRVTVTGCTFSGIGTALHHTRGTLAESNNRYFAVRRVRREDL